MRVLYIAGTPERHGSLLENTEVTELGLLFRSPEGAVHEFVPLPDIPLNSLRSVIGRLKPHVLHLAAHGDDGVLRLRDAVGAATNVSADVLRTFISPEGSLALVYLNACDSSSIASALSGSVPAVVGFEGRITNMAARHAALMFYEEVLAGKSLAAAHQVSAAFVDAVGKVKCVLEGSPEGRTRQLCLPLSIIARVHRRSRDGQYSVQLGLNGLRDVTNDVVFFVSEPVLADRARDSSGASSAAVECALASTLCRVISRSRGRATVWTHEPYATHGDCDIYVMVTLSDHSVTTLTSKLSTALATFVAVCSEGGDAERSLIAAID